MRYHTLVGAFQGNQYLELDYGSGEDRATLVSTLKAHHSCLCGIAGITLKLPPLSPGRSAALINHPMAMWARRQMAKARWK